MKCAGFPEQLVEKAVLGHTAAHHQDHNAHNSQAKRPSHRGGCKECTRCYTRVWALDLRTKTAQGRPTSIYVQAGSKKKQLLNYKIFIVWWFMFEVFRLSLSRNILRLQCRFKITFLAHRLKQSFKIKYKFLTVNYCLNNSHNNQCAAKPNDVLSRLLTYKDQML